MGWCAAVSGGAEAAPALEVGFYADQDRRRTKDQPVRPAYAASDTSTRTAKSLARGGAQGGRRTMAGTWFDLHDAAWDAAESQHRSTTPFQGGTEGGRTAEHAPLRSAPHMRQHPHPSGNQSEGNRVDYRSLGCANDAQGVHALRRRI